MRNMVEILAHWGLDLTTATGVFWLCTVWTFFAVTVIWFIGNFQSDHSMMDGYYGFGYAIPVWIAYLVTAPRSATAAVLLAITSLHGCRLGYYLSNRWRGYQRQWGHGDQRYVGFTKRFSPGYWWKSLFVVMEPQAIVIVVIGIPAVIGVATTREPNGTLTWLAYLGLIIFGIGYYFETVADGQLQAFKADAQNKGRYLRTGVWTHTRHPNYFGNTMVWWGIWLVAVAGNPSIWWTLIGPVFNTIMLTGILGRAFQDKLMGVRPEYKKLMAETNGFLPFPKKTNSSTD
jgi:steroid 5-alpha reductase family enzyme